MAISILQILAHPEIEKVDEGDSTEATPNTHGWQAPGIVRQMEHDPKLTDVYALRCIYTHMISPVHGKTRNQRLRGFQMWPDNHLETINTYLHYGFSEFSDLKDLVKLLGLYAQERAPRTARD